MSLLTSIASGALQVLKTVAPTIADTLAGPFAPLIDPIMQKLFGTTDPKQVSAALLSATPAQLLALKQADNTHAEQLVQLGIDRDKLAFDDTANARAMQIVTKDPTAGRLAWLLIVGFLVVTIGMIVGLFGWPDRAKLLLSGEAGLFFGTIFGYLSSEAKQATAFYFGGSESGQTKDATIASIAKQP
jgi:hypothetical protein